LEDCGHGQGGAGHGPAGRIGADPPSQLPRVRTMAAYSRCWTSARSWKSLGVSTVLWTNPPECRLLIEGGLIGEPALGVARPAGDR
jgi:hypothetical protein